MAAISTRSWRRQILDPRDTILASHMPAGPTRYWLFQILTPHHPVLASHMSAGPTRSSIRRDVPRDLIRAHGGNSNPLLAPSIPRSSRSCFGLVGPTRS